MTTAGSFDAPIEIFGGLVTDMSPADLPHGVSPDCQDVVFSNGNVLTRPGLQALFGPLAGNPTINYIKTYETLNATLRTMVLDSNGNLYKETTPGTLATVASDLAQTPTQTPRQSSAANTSRSATEKSATICRANTTTRISIASARAAPPAARRSSTKT